MTGLRDCVIKFSTYLYFIFKFYLKAVSNTQSNNVIGYVNIICDISHLKSGDKLFEFYDMFRFVGVSSVYSLLK